MAEFITPNDQLTGIQEPKQRPDLLNVLTILTIIWSIFSILSAFYSYATAPKNLENMEKLQSSGDIEKMPAFMRNMMGPEMVEMSRKALANRMPILIVAVVSAALCLYGALQMRKLKKQGYYLWLIGEILPFITTFIFLGAVAYTPFFLFFAIFPIAFIIMYSTQIKYMH